MKKYMIGLILILGLNLNAQNNIFLGRDFWKTQPTIEQVKEKIKEGNNPTEFNQWSFDAVVYAIISHAPTETIEYLTTLKGNEVSKSTHDGRNYLLWAGYAGDYDLVKYLIEQGSDVKWVDDHGFDLVTFTAYGGNTDAKLYDLYKKHGLILKDSKRKGANALLFAAPSVKDIKDLDYFIANGMPLDSEDEEGNNVFLYVVEKGNMPLLKQLKEKGIDDKKINKNNENAILLAAQGGRRHFNKIEVFNYLLSLGLNPLQESNKGENVFHYLAKSNPDWAIFELFLAQKANINAIDKNGNTPYMYAVDYENKMAQNLFKLTKNLDQKNKEGYSALSYAVANLDVKTFSQLIKKGVATDILTAENESLINVLFAHFNQKKMAKFEPIFKELTIKGVKPTINTKNGNNLYHYAVNKNAPQLFVYIKNLGVDIDQMNKEGLTPLHLAAMKSTDLKMMKALVNLGANPRLNTEFGENAEVMALENELLNATPKDLEFLNK